MILVPLDRRERVVDKELLGQLVALVYQDPPEVQGKLEPKVPPDSLEQQVKQAVLDSWGLQEYRDRQVQQVALDLLEHLDHQDSQDK